MSAYRTTKPEYALSLLTDGIRNVQSVCGNAAWGNSFYTHKDKWDSAKYFQPSHQYPTVILEFAASPAVGQKVPRPVASADLSRESLCREQYVLGEWRARGRGQVAFR